MRAAQETQPHNYVIVVRCIAFIEFYAMSVFICVCVLCGAGIEPAREQWTCACIMFSYLKLDLS